MHDVLRGCLGLCRVLLGMVLLGGLLGGQGCVSRCASDLDCVKSCPCGDGTTCTLGLSCVNTLCELEETPICQVPEDFCQKYKDKGLCGSKKCDQNNDCLKRCNPCLANFQPAGGGNVTQCRYECKRTYTCLEDEGMCDQSYASQTCDDICSQAIPQDANCTLPPGVDCKKVSTGNVQLPGN
jgi:hypothetical protein